ncbi:MAG: hypothetical protein GEU75_06625 [Dehalococcoidia bacterium]|nr:hypothetical protein [Dehalococcoidia bacterium]
MDLFDKLAFLGRKYEQQTVPYTTRTRFAMDEILRLFDQVAILELTPYAGNKEGETLRPDPVRKIKVSLLDNGFSALHSDVSDWFEVYRTAPSGDLSKVKIVVYDPSNVRLGEIRMLVGRRTYEHYFEEDPIFEAIARRDGQ